MCVCVTQHSLQLEVQRWGVLEASAGLEGQKTTKESRTDCG